MNALHLVLGASGLFAASGALAPRHGRVVAVLAALTGVIGVALGLGAASTPLLDAAWSVPMGRFTLALDAMSAAFLLPVLVVPALGTIYASAYLPDTHRTARRTRLAYGLLPAAMILVVLARDALVLLMAWELMALAAFFALTADDDDPEVAAAGWLYLVATHLGTLCLIAGFALVAAHTGSLALAPVVGMDADTLGVAALLLLLGFGTKAGLMPLHVWLPGAHANAPSHVSAVMSGVVLTMGIYGVLRVASLMGELPVAAGNLLLALGAISAVAGAALAVVQSDLKRLLAYSSVDNMGIVAVGLGLGLIGRALGRDDLLALGVAGAVLHLWNHALFKPLLFFAAGAVVHTTGTRTMDRLGGLAHGMPRTARSTFVGAAALSGLPPLNGFVSELLIYVGLLRAAADPGWPALAAPTLAVAGALALVAMVKLYGAVFLGTPRQGAPPHDPPAAMSAPTRLLAFACVAIALGAAGVAPLLDRAAADFARRPVTSLLELVPLAAVTLTLAALLAAALLGVRAFRRRRHTIAGTWDCGFAAPTPRIQYTATSLSEGVLSSLQRALRPVRAAPRLEHVLPGPASFGVTVPDPVLARGAPLLARLADRTLPWLRRTQQGSVHLYLLYIVAALIALLMVPS